MLNQIATLHKGAFLNILLSLLNISRSYAVNFYIWDNPKTFYDGHRCTELSVPLC